MSNRSHIKANDIDAILPQTQCGLCEFTGCKPYADAIVNDNAPLDRCLPGGVKTLRILGELVGESIDSLVPEMQNKQKGPAVVSFRENECIGCTKCIQACPVDAIIGASKQMHTVLTDVCNGCELCIEPCPVDCIDIHLLPNRSDEENKNLADFWRDRYDIHQTRLEKMQKKSRAKHDAAKLMQSQSREQTVQNRQQAIAEVLGSGKS